MFHVCFFFCCGNETFLCGDSELKTINGFWFTVTYGVILPWWVPKLRNVGRIPQQSCRKLSCVCLIYCWSMYGACNRWCFFFRNSNIILAMAHKIVCYRTINTVSSESHLNLALLLLKLCISFISKSIFLNMPCLGVQLQDPAMALTSLAWSSAAPAYHWTWSKNI